MKNYICTTCGVQHTATATECCSICDDDRQYIPPNGQNWTTLEKMRTSHRNILREVEPGLTGIVTEPKFAIGQRLLLVQTAMRQLSILSMHAVSMQLLFPILISTTA